MLWVDMAQRILILGFGVEGQSAVNFFIARDGNAQITVHDVQPESALGDIASWRLQGVVFQCGSDKITGDFDLCIRSPGVPVDAPILSELRARGCPITSPTQLFFENCPSKKIVGVTGTKGKGTTSTLIFEIVRAAGLPVLLGGNIGTPMLSLLPEITPDTIVILELSSFQLMDITHSPHIAVVLMTTTDHLDIHGSEGEYIAAKSMITKFQKSEDLLIYNKDYPNSCAIASGARGRVRAISAREADAVVLTPTQLPGRHNLENVCAAVVVAEELGISDEIIVNALRTFRGLEHRLEFVAEYGGVCFYNDSFATNPSNALAAIRAFDKPEILILGGSPKGSDFTELATEIASRGTLIRAIIGIGEEWVRIKEALDEAGVAKSLYIEGCISMPEIIAATKKKAHPGDVVILTPACASFGMFKNYKERGKLFKSEVLRLTELSTLYTP